MLGNSPGFDFRLYNKEDDKGEDARMYMSVWAILFIVVGCVARQQTRGFMVAVSIFRSLEG